MKLLGKLFRRSPPDSARVLNRGEQFQVVIGGVTFEGECVLSRRRDESDVWYLFSESIRQAGISPALPPERQDQVAAAAVKIFTDSGRMGAPVQALRVDEASHPDVVA